MELMKDGLGKPAIKRISKAFYLLDQSFNTKSFEQAALKNIDILELKERVHHIIDALHQHLPNSFHQVIELFTQLKDVWDYGDENDPLRSFAAWPIIDYISVFGKDEPDDSLNTLEYLTSLFSAEFAIRPFIQRYPELCHRKFQQWINHEDENVRRLVSEGTRPRLPWGIRLNQFIDDPRANLTFLTQLKDDYSLYVRRSVANHLNDIAKDHPDVVIKTCKQWYTPNNKNIIWVIKHATRTIVKQGNPEVFSLLGYTERPEVSISKMNLSQNNIRMGETIKFNFELASTAKVSQKCVVDFVIHFIKANGEQKPKVFKLKNINLLANQTLAFTKSFSFKPITTRKYYPGKHKIEILINGKGLDSVEFQLEK